MTAYVEKGLDIKKLPLHETLMSIGNGYMGTRAYLEEFEYEGSIRGNYINGVYETIPMEHAEWAWGFPEQSDRMPNLVDLFRIKIYLDDEEVVINGNIKDFNRELDFKCGLLKRNYKYVTKSGNEAYISFQQMISFSHRFLKSWSLNIDYPGKIKVINFIEFKILNMINEKDPRTASKQIPLIQVQDCNYRNNSGSINLETIRSKINIIMDFMDYGDFNSTSTLNKQDLNIVFNSTGKLSLNRIVRYWDSIRNEHTEFISKEIMYKKQKEYLKEFHNKTKIDFLDHPELTKVMNFMTFHLLQSTTQDFYGNIAAKGLSGEGYEGHYFWDTEIFLFPIWLLWDKERAKNLLMFRYNLLDIGRERALELGHQKGACFSWRTISGKESSGFFPAGSAQFHINFDIAYTFIQWWLATEDIDFLLNYSFELLIETARTALEIGNMEEDGFHIHTVTGPDEYTALVSDNYYTNKMAQYNLKWVVKFLNLLEIERPKELLEIKRRLKIQDLEIEAMNEAANKMVFIYDKEKQIMAQDSTFLSKAMWPKENILRPLLLNYHPLTIYRYQILKQADTVLAQYLLGEKSREVIENSFYYYEKINTHDSSLSTSVSGLMASRLGNEHLSYKYFMNSVFMDLKDLHHNTTDGLHMANIGGSLLSVLKGFGGIRIEEDELYIDPFIPKDIGRLNFRFTWKNTLLDIYIDGDNVDIKKISGDNVEVILKGKKIVIGVKAVLFDLDGVLTGTSDNHYKAWKQLTKELGYDLPLEFKDKLRGISRTESLNLILNYFGLTYSEEEKSNLTMIKNEYYKTSISNFNEKDLYKGVKKLLDKLKSLDVKIALVSASKNALELIENMKIKDYFNVIVDPESVEKGKPYPDPFLAAAEMLNIPVNNCLGVEDAQAGIDSINSAGMMSLGIGEEDLKGADYLYSTIEEASDFIIDWAVNNYGRN